MSSNEPTLTDFKFRLMIHRKWKSGANANKTFEKIRSKFNNISKSVIEKWFDRFNNENTLIFCNNSKLSISAHSKEPLNSLLLMIDDKRFKDEMLTNDGQFLIFSYNESWNNHYVVIYDLFQDIKRKISIDFKICRVVPNGKYLLITDWEAKLHVFKIDYKNTTIKELDSVSLKDYAKKSLADFIPDQSNSDKFLIYKKEKCLMGQIQNDKVVLSDPKNIDINLSYIRLVGDKLQGFNYSVSTTKFCDLNFETMEKNEFDAQIVLNDETELNSVNIRPWSFCWSKIQFYGMFEIENTQYWLLTFNSNTLKWSNVGISASRPRSLFVNSNEILTMQIGKYNDFKALYRLALRKPDLLLNLTQLAILRESNIFGNDKCLKVARQIQLSPIDSLDLESNLTNMEIKEY